MQKMNSTLRRLIAILIVITAMSASFTSASPTQSQVVWVVAKSTQIGPCETFEMIELGNDVVAFKAANGKYVTAEHGGNNAMVGHHDALLEWQKFKRVSLGDNMIALKAHLGQYVIAEYGGTNLLSAKSTALGAWEKFQVINLGDNKVALKVHRGQYVGIEGGCGGVEARAGASVLVGTGRKNISGGTMKSEARLNRETGKLILRTNTWTKVKLAGFTGGVIVFIHTPDDIPWRSPIKKYGVDGELIGTSDRNDTETWQIPADVAQKATKVEIFLGHTERYGFWERVIRASHNARQAYDEIKKDWDR